LSVFILREKQEFCFSALVIVTTLTLVWKRSQENCV